MSERLSWFNLFLIIVIFIIIIVLFIWLDRERQSGTSDGTADSAAGIVFPIIQNGVTSGNVDELSMGSSILYVKQTSSLLNLTFPPGRTKIGLVIGVVNGTNTNIQVVRGSNATLNAGSRAFEADAGTIFPGTFSQWVVTGPNSYIRAI